MRIFRSAVGTPKTAPTKPEVSIPEIDKRTARAAQLEQIFKGIKPGQTLANAQNYLDIIQHLNQQTVQDATTLFRPDIKITPSVQKAREALQKQVIALQKALIAAQAANILPKPSFQPSTSGPQLRDRKDSPLHLAVRKHDHQAALIARHSMRQARLTAICQQYMRTIKKPDVIAILKKPNFLGKLLPAIEKIHILNGHTFNSKELQKHFKDADILKVIQDPEFRKILTDPHFLLALNGLDVLADLDTYGMSPLHEALLQQDSQMTQLLLFPQFAAESNSELKKIFWNRLNDLQVRIATMRQVEPTTLSDTCKAAYLGNIDELEKLTDFNVTDPKGLTPLHYALLGGQLGAIQYLLPRTNIYTLTKQGHSYLDYAILSGHAGLLNHFQGLKLPFRLGTDQEKFSYLLASGILDQQLLLEARAKDPIAMGGKDQNLPGTNLNVNAVWAGSTLLSSFLKWAFGIAPEKSWVSTVTQMANTCNTHILGVGQVLNLFPAQTARPAAKLYQFYQKSILPIAFLYQLVGQRAINAVRPMVSSETAATIESGWGTLVTIGAVATKCFSLLRFCGAVKPVIGRIPAYIDSFRSRPKTVLKALAYDAFNIGTQTLMTDFSFAKDAMAAAGL